MFSKNKKYKVLDLESVEGHNGEVYKAYRIQALIDIPLHGVKKGDLGGYITSKKDLDHEGSCWIGGEAIAAKFTYGSYSYITGNALITDRAIITESVRGNVIVRGQAYCSASLSGNIEISDNAQVHSGSLSGNITLKDNVVLSNVSVGTKETGKVIIEDNVSLRTVSNARYDFKGNEVINNIIMAGDEDTVKISGSVSIENVNISGMCFLEGDFNLQNFTAQGDNTILGSPKIMPDLKLTGTNKISGSAVIPPSSHLHDVTIDSGVYSYLGIQSSPSSPTANDDALSSESLDHISVINDIEAEYESYTTDVVKLIKYPAMSDSAIPEVAEFLVSLRAAKRALKSGKESKLESLANQLEMSFVRAENRVRVLVTSHLDDTQKKSLQTAEKMFKLACDEASPEPEKRLSVKAGLRSLEGIVEVSEKAVENLKERVGILELEA